MKLNISLELIGLQVLPSKEPESGAEFFSEAVKAIGSMSDLSHQPSIEFSSYTQDVPAANVGDANVAVTAAFYQTSAVNSGSFVVGIDLENYANSDKSAIFAGLNSNTDDIYFLPTFKANDPAVVSARFDAFAMFDTVLVFENNIFYVKY